ncbi:MAG: glycyl radical protein [Verrucomicrobiota bacterium]|jgi:formate C-acetyltransferase
MNDRTARLRRQSLDTPPSISGERARLVTEFYQANEGRYSAPVMRALAFRHLCQHKTIYLGEDELIVGERGPRPKAAPTFPELTCHSLEDLRILNSRPKTWYRVEADTLQLYQQTVIPYWRGRSLRDRMFAELPPEWQAAYQAGLFTEFMEQRAPGHTVLDDKIYAKGLRDFQRDIADSLARLDFLNDQEAYEKRETLKSFDISCEAVILFAERHAALARELAGRETRPQRRAELLKIAAVCAHVPARAPRDFHEALQCYWFCHLAVITELNGWDSFNPGHLDQHLLPFYQQGLTEGALTPDSARELLECFFIKFNNHPAPPKVGVTAAESGTYTDFANLNLGGLRRDGAEGANVLSHLLLDIVEEMHLLQPGSNIQLSRKSPDAFLKHALRVVSRGYGFPSIFNADTVVAEQLRQGKTLEDARAGGCSGCVEVGAFGKEAYILTGYFNLVKVLELTLHNGRDPRTGQPLGPRSGEPDSFQDFESFFAAFRRQLRHFIQVKIRGSRLIERMYADDMPAPFLSVLIDDCIAKGRDYNAGGARYNNTFLQMVGLGSITDCLSAIKELSFGPPAASGEPPAAANHQTAVDEGAAGRPRPQASGGCSPALALARLVSILDQDFAGQEVLRQRLLNGAHKYGNDDDYADDLMRKVFNACFEEVDGRPDARGGRYRIEMLPTTCHIYFGSVVGAMPDGRKAGLPVSEGISPVQGADRHGPTAVLKSAAKMDQVKTGGTLLNLKFTPALVAGEDGLDKWAHLVRSYFKMDGHHVQFNVVTADTLRQAQANPEAHRDLIVRVAGYSDYFCDLAAELQDEIITRTEHQTF